MKKYIISVFTALAIFFASPAQNLISKIPSTASLVIKYSGDNLAKNMPLQKADTYGFIKDNLFKLLHIDTLTSLQNIGINFDRDIFQYVIAEDTSVSFVTLVHLKNAQQFLQLVKAASGTNNDTEKKNGFEYLAVSANTHIGLNETMAVIINTTYQNRQNYYDYIYRSDTTAPATADSLTVTVAADTVAAADVIRFTPPKIVKDKSIKAPAKPIKKPVTVKGKTAVSSKTKKPVAAKKPPVKKKIVDEEVMEAPPEVVMEDSDYGLETAKRELWYQEQEIIAAAKQRLVAEKIMTNTFTGTIYSIENELSYKKITDPAAHVSAWYNYENLMKQFRSYFIGGRYMSFYDNSNYLFSKDTSAGFKSAANVYFEKDKMRVEQKTFSADTKMANMGKELMNNKQNTGFVNYINPGNIGYFSMSVNTEAMVSYYYQLIKNYLSNTPYISEYAEVVDVYIDLMEIMIDEKSIAELMPGNYLFVMHDMKTKQVSYTDYTYDKEFNRTEVKKTKDELSPDFTFIMETKKESFMQKVVNLPVKYA